MLQTIFSRLFFFRAWIYALRVFFAVELYLNISFILEDFWRSCELVISNIDVLLFGIGLLDCFISSSIYFSPCRDKLRLLMVAKPQRKALWKVNISLMRLMTVPTAKTIGMFFVVSQTILPDSTVS
jgi:hypothetical protein